MNSTYQKGSGSVTAIIVLVVIVLVGWLAYSQGLFDGEQVDDETNTSGIEVNVGASTE